MQIPQTYTLDDKKRKSILKYDKIDESDGIYPIGHSIGKKLISKNYSR